MAKLTKKQASQTRHNIALIKIGGFLLLLVVMGFIGLLWFARPKTSTLEKRELTAFPKLTLQGVWDGSFCSGVDTWYADTYPLREGLISLDTKMEDLYGIRGEQLVDGGQVADEIPDESVNLAELASQGREEPPETAEPTKAPSGETEETEENNTEQTEDPGPVEGAGDVTTPAEQAGTIYITENCGYGIYNFSLSESARYCLAVNSVAAAVQGKAQVYCLIGPISAGIMLSDKVLKQVGGSDEAEAMNWMFSQMDPSVRCVNVYSVLKQHNNEYIYFHTDHHWTALGAYYAYTEFCRQKGIEPHKLTDFKTKEYTGFLGTFYSSSNQSPALASNPDTVTAYIPNGTNDMEMYSNYDSAGGYTKYNWNIIYDVSSYPRSEYYATFAGGDQPFNYAHNETITDGSTVLIVKDSYGNAFIPFLVDHYEHIYWIDYRAYDAYCAWAGTGSSTLSAFVQAHDVDDVILCNNINSTGSSSLLDYMEKIFK